MNMETAEYAEGYAVAWDAATERAIGEIDSKEYAAGYDRGERVASARAESRRRLGLPIAPAIVRPYGSEEGSR
jgi:hypothetical protein